MLEVKFRAHIKETNKIEKVTSLHDNGVIWTKGRRAKDGFGYSADEYDLMQYTGLKDENGKEIYEGDIVHYECLSLDLSGVVEINNLSPIQGFFGHLPCDPTNGDVFLRVIGNIYENPNILREVKIYGR